MKKVVINPNVRDLPYCISVKTLTTQLRHDLGLKKGDSFSWLEKNPRTGKIETHFLNFDRSGLDERRRRDLPRLVNFAKRTG